MPEFQLESAGTVLVQGFIDPAGVIRAGNSDGTRSAGGAVLGFADLDEFTQGYIEALFFTDNEPGMTREQRELPEWQERIREGQAHEIPGDFGFDDLAPEALRDIMANCFDFQNGESKRSLDLAYDYAPDGYEPEQAGRDLWFTRNGHGCGYWDRGLGEVGNVLADDARKIGASDTCIGDDGLVHVS